MNIYVGNISFNTSESELLAHFEAVGTVTEAKIITDRDSGRPRGFGFVTMPDNGEANRAIEELNGVELDSRALVVNQARERQRNFR